VKAPFPWFGGKRRVAPLIWSAFGDVDNYTEPFAGSLAVLLERPAWHKARAETVNDADQFLANFWRAVAADPDAVAAWCDWPVNEADLFARHLWLVNTGRERLAAMDTDPEWFDAKVAGWWVWGICAWIGSGWCSGTGPHTLDTSSKLPHLGNAGQGVNRQLPHLGNAGRGVNRKLPHLGDAGQGVNGPADTAFSKGGSGATDAPWTNPTPDLPPVYGYMRLLAERLRNVRVCCGNWDRVVTTGALNYGATKGVLLDPPYLGDVRTSDLYATDDHTIAHEVREWAIANGDNPAYRIALCGYEPEHIDHMPATWRMHTYSASKSYGSSAGGGDNDANRALERIWFSPHCLGAADDGQLGLWDAA
jgi:site-specific DNA-adenine methylase